MRVQYYSGETDGSKYIYLKKDDLLQPVGEFHDSIEIIFMLEGRAEGYLYDRAYVLEAGDIFFVDSYEGHWYKHLTEKLSAYVLVLSREYLQDFRDLYPNQTFMTYMSDKKLNEKIFALVSAWYEETDKMHIKDLGYADILFSYLSESYGLTKRTLKNDREEFIKVLLLYLHEHYLEDITLATVSKSLGYSVDYCSKVLKKSIGRSFREYINMLRIRKANALMTDKSLNMTTLEILYKCGFKSPTTFYRAKKRFESESLATNVYINQKSVTEEKENIYE